MKKITLLLSIVLLLFSVDVYSKKKSSKKDSIRVDTPKNIIKWNLTPLIWNRKNINLSYERATSDRGSFSVNAGIFLLPKLGLFDSIKMAKTGSQSGFNISADKRFFFRRRNTRNAPDGLYWGVFGAFYHYNFKNSFTVTNSEIAQGTLNLRGDITIFSAGIELGYQFVLKNNITIDLIFMGPALSRYSGSLGVSGNFKVDEESEYVKAIYDVLVGRFPGVDKLLDEKSINDKGTIFSLGPGLRYMIQIGYCF